MSKKEKVSTINNIPPASIQASIHGHHTRQYQSALILCLPQLISELTLLSHLVFASFALVPRELASVLCTGCIVSVALGARVGACYTHPVDIRVENRGRGLDCQTYFLSGT